MNIGVNNHIMKKIYLFFILVLGLLCSSVSNAENPFAGGKGTASEPFLVKTAEQLDAVRNYLKNENDENEEGYYFKQIDDIDLATWLTINGGSEGWMPIGGDYLKPFKGHFDGDIYSINGLWINNTGLRNASLFAQTSEDATLTNIDVKIVSPGIIGNAKVAGLVGDNEGKISKCTVSIAEDAVIEGADEDVAGLVGCNYSTGIITDCSVDGQIVGDNDDPWAMGLTIGGLVGTNRGLIDDCSTSCHINVTAEWAKIGGLVGDNGNYMEDLTINNSTADVDFIVIGNSNCIGGLAGINSGLISNSFTEGEKIITIEGDYISVGGLVGQNQNSINTCFSNWSVTVEGKGCNVGGLVGSVQEGTLITKSYASGEVIGKGDNVKVGGLVGSGIGSIIYSFACGSVIGNGYQACVGGLVGSSEVGWETEEISYSYASGSVTADGDKAKVGGLAGYCESTINTCYSIGVVKGTGNNAIVGGLVGSVEDRLETILTSSFFLQNKETTNIGLFGVGGDDLPFINEATYRFGTLDYPKNVLPRKAAELKKENTFSNIATVPVPWDFLENPGDYDVNHPTVVWLIDEEVADDEKTSPYLWWQSENKPKPKEEPAPVKYKITLVEGEGYTIVNEFGNSFTTDGLTVIESSDFKFKVNLKPGYEQSKSNMKVYTNLSPDAIDLENGLYSITVTDNITIRVEGVTKNPHKITFEPGTGYTFVNEHGDDFTPANLSVIDASVFKFRIKLESGYNQINSKVYTDVSLDPIMPTDDLYSITVNSDITIRAEGITQNPASNSDYNNFTLGIASGIKVRYFSSGDHSVEVGNYLYMYFSLEDPEATAENVLLLVDGVETPFTQTTDSEYPYYCRVLSDADHTIVIAMRTYIVTLPETVGATIDHGPGDHSVAYGDSFCFCLTPEEGNSCAGARVFANGEELLHDGLRSDGSLYYTLDKVSCHVKVTIEGLNPTGNLNIDDNSLVKITTGNGKLMIDNEGEKNLELSIYTLGGQLYTNRSLPLGTTTVILPQGIYIVQAGDITRKVSIK